MVNITAEGIIASLREQSDKQRALDIARYLKTSSLKFIGVTLPLIRKTVKKHLRGMSLENMVSTMSVLWKDPIFEFRVATAVIMETYAKNGDTRVALDLISKFIDDIDTWALMDPLGSPGLGTLLRRDAAIEATLVSWRTSENFWRRRATILPYLHLSMKSHYNEENASRILDALKPHLSDKEFFVGKAVGWVLRELSKRNPEIVREFIEENRDSMTKLAIREGSKKL
ncbi:MAG: DNA alkylation repair protein [Candidatus Thorarchaeota archaeon]